MTPSEPVGLILAQLGPPGSGLEQMLPLVLILVVFYFLLVRPQQKRASEHKAFVAALKKNDQVVTVGGLHGRIVDVSEDVVTLEIAPNVIVRHDRAQIGGSTSPPPTKDKNGKGQRRAGS